ncbi:MAG: hypothetical protein AAGC53_08735 [Actinomycetota bacterium]
MPWFIENMDMVEAMADIARNPEKLEAFKNDPHGYLASETKLNDVQVAALTSDNHEAVIEALLGKVEPNDKRTDGDCD